MQEKNSIKNSTNNEQVDSVTKKRKLMNLCYDHQKLTKLSIQTYKTHDK